MNDSAKRLPFEPGAQVRRKFDSGRIGIVQPGGKERRGLWKVKVSFGHGPEYVREDQLELVPIGPENPVDLLKRGRTTGVRDLRRTLTHARLSGRLANVIYSMNTTGTDFYAHQFKPVVRLLNSAQSGILIADEVGLGKTIEAGLLWTELRARFDFRRLLVVCPAVLQEKWQRELRTRFGVEAEILNARGTLERLRQSTEKGNRDQFAIIGSMQGLRARRTRTEVEGSSAGGPSTHLADFLEDHGQEEPLIDLCIVDEAHYMRNRERQTAALGRALRKVSEYMVLLSATPVHLGNKDLYHLLNLVDPDNFRHFHSFEEIVEANKPLVRAREALLSGQATTASLHNELERAMAHPLLANSRQLESLLSELDVRKSLRDAAHVASIAERLERVNLLGGVLTRTRKREVQESRVQRDVTSQDVPLTDVEAQFYDAVTEVVRDYSINRGVHQGFLLVTPQRQVCSCMPAALRAWQAGTAADDEMMWEDLGQDQDSDADRPLLSEIMRRAGELANLDELWNNDSKYKRLEQQLRALFEKDPSEKVVLFSYFRPTLAYLYERLRDAGIECVVLHGGIPNKDEVVDGFRESPEGAVLLSSEVGSEGIDLQFSRIVINYDLPWNPMRVEQRIGRIDRLGQRANLIHVWNLFYENTIDARIYHRLFERLGIFKETLGGLEPVLGDKIGDLTRDLFSRHLTPAQEEARIEQTRLALEQKRRDEEELEAEAVHLVAYGDYIWNQVKAAKQLHRTITDEDLRAYVTDFFVSRYQGCVFTQVADDPNEVTVDLSHDARHDLASFFRNERLESGTRLTRNDVRDVRVRFENTAVPSPRAREEVISQFHPLTRFVRARMEASDVLTRPATALQVALGPLAGELMPGNYGFSVQRWWVKGLRDVERLYYAACPLRADAAPLSPELAERLVGIACSEGEIWARANAALDFDVVAETVDEWCIEASDQAFDDHVDAVRSENHDRAEVQERTLLARYEREQTSLREVLERHVARGNKGLVAAQEGKIRASTNRMEKRRREIGERRELRHGKEDICVGVIRVMSDLEVSS
jgi:superfamily II DNA or RNA helicase